jgi:hypothetical protein
MFMRVLSYLAAALTASVLLGCDDHTDTTDGATPTMPVIEAPSADPLTTQPGRARVLVADAKLKQGGALHRPLRDRHLGLMSSAWHARYGW